MKAKHQFQIQAQLKSTCLTQGGHICKYVLNHQDYMKHYLLFVPPNTKHYAIPGELKVS